MTTRPEICEQGKSWQNIVVHGASDVRRPAAYSTGIIIVVFLPLLVISSKTLPTVAEIVRKKLPVVVVTEKKKADYILAGSFIKGDGKWHHTVFGVTDKNEGSVQLINVKNKRLVWVGGAGDRSLFLGGWSRGGQSKVADRIVNKMKKDLFSHRRTNADRTQRNNLSAKGNTNSNTGNGGTKTPRR